MLSTRAYAKINLGLEIVGRRADGYHDVVTILQQIDLADTLTFGEASDVSLTSSDRSLETELNLVVRAARLLRDATGVRSGVAIYLDKRIPIAAGLGGGSSDAAATLLALNRWWRLGLAPAELGELARQVGTDVSFFLRGGTQLATGRGDQLSSLPTPRLHAVLLFAADGIEGKTGRLYAALKPEDYSDGRVVFDHADRLLAGNHSFGGRLASGFERAALALFPDIGRGFESLTSVGAVPSLCGAGPTIMSLHERVQSARLVASKLCRAGYHAIVAATMPTGDSVDGS